MTGSSPAECPIILRSNMRTPRTVASTSRLVPARHGNRRWKRWFASEYGRLNCGLSSFFIMAPGRLLYRLRASLPASLRDPFTALPGRDVVALLGRGRKLEYLIAIRLDSRLFLGRQPHKNG